MLVPRDLRPLGHLPAPQFQIPGPFTKGTKVPITLHLRSNTDEKDVRVRFLGEGLTFSHDELVLEYIERHIPREIEVVGTVNEHATDHVRVWCELHGSAFSLLETAVAFAPVRSRARLRLELDDDALVMANDGDKAATVVLSASSGTKAFEDLAFNADGISEPFILTAQSERRVRLGDYIGSIMLVDHQEGERAVLRRNSTDVARPLIEASLGIKVISDGVRYNEDAPFEVTMRNGGAAPATQITIELPLPQGIFAQPELLTIDHTRMVPSDYAISNERLVLRVGRLGAGTSTTIRGQFRVKISSRAQFSTIPIEGTLTAKGLPGIRLRNVIPLNREPQFTEHTSHLGEFEERDHDTLAIPVVITNAEPIDIENVRVRIELLDAALEGILDEDQRPLTTSPSIFAGRPTRLVSLGTLFASQRRELTAIVTPTDGSSNEHRIRARATLLLDAHSIPLGEREYVLPEQVDFSRSRIEFPELPADMDERAIAERRALQLSHPVTLRLIVENSGRSIGEDVRIALNMPPEVRIGQIGQPNGRWYRIAEFFDRRGKVDRQFILTLEAPISQDHFVIEAEIDAKNAPAVKLPPITIYTPTESSLVLSKPTIKVLEKGLLEVSASLTNQGDGIARNIMIFVPREDCPIPRTTVVFDSPIPEEGDIPAVCSGLNLPDLPPDYHHDFAYIVSPPTGQYIAHMRVTSQTQEICAQSEPVTSHPHVGFAAALPAPRPVKETMALAPQAIAPSIDELRGAAVIPEETRQRALGSTIFPSAPPTPTNEDAGAENAFDLADIMTQPYAEMPEAAAVGATHDAPAHGASASAQAPNEPAASTDTPDVSNAPPAPSSTSTQPFEIDATEAPAASHAPTTQPDVVDERKYAIEDPPEIEIPFVTHSAINEADREPEPAATTFAWTDEILSARPEDHVLVAEAESALLEPPAAAPTNEAPDNHVPSYFGTPIEQEAPTPDINTPEAAQTSVLPDKLNASADASRDPELTGDDAGQFLNIVPLLQAAKGLAGWNHAIAIRLLVPSRFHEARTTVQAFVERILPLLLTNDPEPKRPFINAAINYDPILRDDLTAFVNDIGETEAQLDQRLAEISAAAIETDSAEIQGAYQEYRRRLIEFFGINIFVAQDDDDRQIRLSVEPIIGLDEALDALAEHIAVPAGL